MRSHWTFGLVLLAGGVLFGFLLGLALTEVAHYRPRPRESALPEMAEDMPSPPGLSVSSFTISQTPSPAAVKVALTRKLIREVWLTLKVQDVVKTVQQVRQIAEQLDGYVANASQSRDGEGKWSAELVLKVPSERYHEALSQLQKLGQVDDLREQVQDVTEEFIDLEARLRNLKRSEQHLLELLKRTGKVSDLLQVERELSQRRSEIERIEGRLRYLTHQTSFSTIHITLEEFRPSPIPATAFSIPKVFGDAFRTVVLILRAILVIAIWVLVFGIIWVPLSAFAWWWARRLQRVGQEISTTQSE
ncbi:MAG: DUF4349 domain-containing protein [Armatimonadota bacterium]